MRPPPIGPWPLALPMLLLLCLGIACQDTSRPEAAVPPNIVLIVVDTLRADHLSHYGYDRPTAEALDDFRAGSTLYRNAFSTAAWTGPSTISLITGLSPLRHRAEAHGDVVPAGVPTLAERLQDAGYKTLAISHNYEVSRATGHERGYDLFDDFAGDVLDYPDVGAMVRRVDRWTDAELDAPFFLYLQPMTAHGPYRVPNSRRRDLLGRAPSDAFEYYGDAMKGILRRGELDRRAEISPEIVESLVDQYDVAVHYTISEVARLLARLEAAGHLDGALVILTSDHGEELFDHGGFSHGYSLYREVLHVPLYVQWPDGSGAGHTVDGLVSILDVMPTILEVAGLPEPEGLDGRSLRESDAETRVLLQRTAWAERAVGTSTLSDGLHWIDLESAYDAESGRQALYDWQIDPGERADLAADDARRGRAVRAEADRRAAIRAAGPALEVENALDEMDEARLRALGYIE